MKFAHLDQKSEKCSISNLSTKVPALIKCLKDRERYVRNLAVTALGNVGEHAGLAVPALTSDSDA